jgi:hypothetical protein
MNLGSSEVEGQVFLSGYMSFQKAYPVITNWFWSMHLCLAFFQIISKRKEKILRDKVLSISVNFSYTRFDLCPLMHHDFYHHRQVILPMFLLLSYQTENFCDN